MGRVRAKKLYNGLLDQIFLAYDLLQKYMCVGGLVKLSVRHIRESGYPG